MLKEESDFYYNIPRILQEINESLKTIAEAMTRKKERKKGNLTWRQKKYVEIAVKDSFECGHFYGDSIEEVSRDFEEYLLFNKRTAELAAEYYMELVGHGPAGFYEEFKDKFDDWDESFVTEYGDKEDEDVEEEDID